MKSTLERIEEIRRSGYNLDLGEVINDAFANYKNIALLGGAVILLVSIAGIVIFGGIAGLFIGVAALTETLTEIGDGGQLGTTALIVNLVVTTIAFGLFAPLSAGLIQMAHNASIKEDFDFSTAFMYYKSEHFKDLFLATAVITLVSSGVGTLFQILNQNQDLTLLAIIGVVNGLISVLISLFTLLTIPLIIFGNLNAFDAIKGSFTVVSKNFWTILLLAIVFIIFGMLGIFAICIGIFFTAPIWYSMIYIIYKQALPIEEINELEEIGQNRF